MKKLILIVLGMLVLPSVIYAKTPTTDFKPYYGSGDLMNHIAKEINDRIKNVTAGPSSQYLWTSKGTDTKTWKVNPNNWTTQIKPLDWTGVSPWNTQSGDLRGGVLISPRHVLHANHFKFGINHKIVFVSKTGENVIRTITDVRTSNTSDIAVALLDSDVPDYITFYPIISRESWIKYTSTKNQFAYLPIIVFDREDKLGIRVVQASNLTGDMYSLYHEKSLQEKELSFNEEIITGDSGNPSFLVIGGQPVLLFAHYTADFGPNLSNMIPELNKLMSSLGGGYQVSTLDLSKFTRNGEQVASEIPAPITPATPAAPVIIKKIDTVNVKPVEIKTSPVINATTPAYGIWKFDDLTGNDSSGLNHVLKIGQNITAVNGKIGKALLFNPSTRTFGGVTKDTFNPSQWSLSIWVSPKYPIPSTAPDYNLYALISGDKYTKTIGIKKQGVFMHNLQIGSYKFEQNQGWKHIVVTYDGTTLAAYVDKVKIGSVVAENPFTLPLIRRIGSYSYADPTYSFQGLVDETRLYKNVITQTEINALFDLSATNVQ